MSQTISNDYINMINKKGSGYNIPVIVDAIVNAAIEPIRTQVTSKIDATDATISGLGSLKSSAQTSKTVIDAFDANLNFTLLSSKTAALTITAGNSDELSSFSKQIAGVSLARSRTFTINNYNTAAVFGAQTLTVRNTANVVMGTVIVAAGETVGAVAGKLDRVSGLKAELVDSGSGSVTPHSLLISGDLGAANNFTITSNVNGKINTAFAGVGAGSIQQGRDANVIMDGVAISRPTNEITDLVKGTTIKLLADDMGPITISSSLSSASVMATVKELMAELNLYKADLDALGFVDTVGDDNGALAQNAYLRSAQTQFARFMAKPLMGYVSNDVENVPVYFVEFGIKTTKAGTFEFDKTAFDRTFEREPEKFAALAVDRAYSSDPNVIVTATAASTIPTGAHNYENHHRYAQRAGVAHLQSGDYAPTDPITPPGPTVGNPLRPTTLTYTVEPNADNGAIVEPTGSYTVPAGGQSLQQIAANWNPTDGVSVTYDPGRGRLLFTWTLQETSDLNPAPHNEQGENVTVTHTGLSNDVTGVAQQTVMSGFSGAGHVLPTQTISYRVRTDATNTTTTRSIFTNGSETVAAFAARLNGLGHGVSATMINGGTQMRLAATNPAAAHSFTISTIPIAVAPVPQVIEMSKTYGVGDLVAAGNYALAITPNGATPQGLTAFTTSGTQTPAQAVIAFNALNNGITASFSGTRLRFAATNPSTHHSFTVGTIPAVGGGQTTTTAGSAGSAGGTQAVSVPGNRRWGNTLGNVAGIGVDERFADVVSGNANFEIAEAQPGGSGVYNSPNYTGFQFQTTNDQIDMTFYIARSAKTELSRFFKDALSTTGIYRTVVDSYTDQGKQLANRLDTIDERKLALQASYTKQFAAMEKVVTGNSSTSEFITNLVAGWNKD
jgi:flagellar hook-associated protein 2